MGLFTSFLSLFKPDYTDVVDIADINSNMDKIDARFKGINDGTFAVNKAINCSGNAATATKLQTARNINGVAFDGTKNITIADSTKAPISHASSATTYGVGTTANYGHCKTINNLTQSSHVNGNALSAYQGKLINDKLPTLIKTQTISVSKTMAASTAITGDFSTYDEIIFKITGSVSITVPDVSVATNIDFKLSDSNNFSRLVFEFYRKEASTFNNASIHSVINLKQGKRKHTKAEDSKYYAADTNGEVLAPFSITRYSWDASKITSLSGTITVKVYGITYN
jgi:hypothetical protein